MMRALYAGVSGLQNEQTALDVIGNNIANVNTTAFKASRVTFKEAFTQLLQGASRPPGDLGGINPIQIGSGSSIGSIDQEFSQGTLNSTGQATDLAIQGDSFFVVNNGSGQQYTRAGNFQLDAGGRLITPSNGYTVQGVMADSSGNFSSSSIMSNIVLPFGQKTAAHATGNMTLSGNLDATATIGTTQGMGVTVYDGLGAPHQLQLTFTNTGPGAWSWTGSSDTATLPSGTGTATFNTDGTLATFTCPGGGSKLTVTPTNGGDPFDVTVAAGTVGAIDGLSGFANTSDAVVSNQDGYQSGNLQSISIDASGVIHGAFSNGTSRALAQIALAKFTNPSGLLAVGDNSYSQSANSGLAVIGYAGTSDPSTITPGALENSNVDLSQQFTDMIVAQRGFQANASVIKTADQMLNDLVNLRQ